MTLPQSPRGSGIPHCADIQFSVLDMRTLSERVLAATALGESPRVARQSFQLLRFSEFIPENSPSLCYV